MSQEKTSPQNFDLEKIKSKKDLHVEAAQQQAEKDIEQDVDLNTEPELGDDLDEGELAKLEGED